MEIVLLGSGSADGWPNPFCRCASCETQRRGGVRRVATSALVDGALLLDFGPDTARQAESLGVDLTGVRAALVTHAHPDHLAPAALLWRRWAVPPPESTDPLSILGPASVTDEVQHWYAAEPSVQTRTLSAGNEFEVAGYQVRALPANHEVETLLYDVTAPDGARLLYATDTGLLPPAMLAAVDGRGYEAVLLEQTFGRRLDHATRHLDLATFPRTLAALRDAGALTDATRVVAIHLGHHNPPEPELTTTLARWGVEPGRDGMRITLRASAEQQSLGTEPSPSSPVPRRSLVLGGVRSGKSSFAEAMLADESEVVYVATGGERPDDPDWRARVAAHQARRPLGWHTVTTTDLVTLLEDDGPPLLIDCLTLWLTAAMDAAGAWQQAAWAATGRALLAERVDALVAAWRHTTRRVVAVTNEVGGGIVPETWSGRVFRDEMGRLNARIAAESDDVHLVVAGLEMRLR